MLSLNQIYCIIYLDGDKMAARLKLITAKLCVFVIAFVSTVMIANNFVVSNTLKAFTPSLQNIAITGAAAASIVGLYGLVTFYLRNIRRKTGNWYLNVWSLILIFMMVSIGTVGTSLIDVNNWLSSNWYVNLQSAMYALTFFYVTSAAFRAFKARSIDAALLLLSSMLVTLGNTPIIQAIVWDRFPEVSNFLLNNIASPAYNALYIGMSAGALGLFIRVLLGYERGFLRGLSEVVPE